MLDGLESLFLLFVLNVANASTCSVIVELKFTLYNLAELHVSIVESFLRDSSCNVSDEDVSFWIRPVVGLNTDSNCFAVNL